MGIETKDALNIKELHIKNGSIRLPSVTAIAAQAISITNVGCAGIGTATISGWLEIVVAGVTYYIPVWT
jgi:hypothetical protein